MISPPELNYSIACYGVEDLGLGVSIELVSCWLDKFDRVKVVNEFD